MKKSMRLLIVAGFTGGLIGLPIGQVVIPDAAAHGIAADLDCQGDLSCSAIADGYTVAVRSEEPNGDESNWDCRVHGNADCGTEALAQALGFCDERHAVLVERWACWDGAYIMNPGV